MNLLRLLNRGALVAALTTVPALGAAELHVALNGNDANRGTAESPFRTIQHAADVAQPGDTITVHAGIYRERVDPPRGGTSDTRRIIYQAAPGEDVEIAGSEVVTGWKHVNGDVWTVTLPNSYFHGFNPYRDELHGDWFEGLGRVHHTGAVYLHGKWLSEAATLGEVLKGDAGAQTTPGAPDPGAALPQPAHGADGAAPSKGTSGAAARPTGPLWFARVDDHATTLWAQFGELDPNYESVEINVRRTVFYPDQPGRNFITVRGFVLRDAATPWAPPTAEQIGIIGTNWSKGWVIERNIVRHSICCGISLGKYGDAFDNTSANSAEGYVATIKRAHAFRIPWSGDAVGHHLVRFNTISDCEQAGIVGSLGGAFSTITGNAIHDIHVRRLFSGAEMAGIKLHGAIDVVISHNNIFHCNRGIWLDWMAQGTRVTANVFHDNGPSEDLFFEVDHGPYLVDNNVFLSPSSILDISEGGAYAHNLVTGRITCRPDNRDTPFHPPHSTTVSGMAKVTGGDDRFYNNIFVGRGAASPRDAAGKNLQEATSFGLCCYDHAGFPLHTGGNVYLNGACAYANEASALKLSDPFEWHLAQADGRLQLEVRLPAGLSKARTQLVTTRSLGKARVAGAAYENPDGSPLSLDEDYFGKHREPRHPTAGPFETDASGIVLFNLW